MSARAESLREGPSAGLFGARALVLVAILAAGLGSAWALDLSFGDLIPGPGGRQVAAEFFSRALSPALTYEAASVPEGTRPLWLKALTAAKDTVVFAAAAMSLALVLGVVLGFCASTAWWAGEPLAGESRWRVFVRRSLGPLLYGVTRPVIAFLRSVHELLWAVLFLAALGLGNLTAVLAIVLPYAGTLAKVFSEMVDETPRKPARALREAGASPLQVFCVGLLPPALADMAAYAFYRFECALRSSAILGFFGFPTLGYYISASFENLHYGEVWTYLYTLLALVVVADLWSGAVRRRFVR